MPSQPSKAMPLEYGSTFARRWAAPSLARRADDLGVVARDEHLAAAGRRQLSLDGDRGIEPARSRDLEALHAAGECLLTRCLDQQVDVVPLDAHVHDADQPEHRRGEDREADGVIGASATQATDSLGYTQHDMDRRP